MADTALMKNLKAGHPNSDGLEWLARRTFWGAPVPAVKHGARDWATFPTANKQHLIQNPGELHSGPALAPDSARMGESAWRGHPLPQALPLDLPLAPQKPQPDLTVEKPPYMNLEVFPLPNQPDLQLAPAPNIPDLQPTRALPLRRSYTPDWLPPKPQRNSAGQLVGLDGIPYTDERSK